MGPIINPGTYKVIRVDGKEEVIQEDEELIAAIMNNRTGGSNASTKI